jgi:transcriptional regulator with XRE-family HTH domain
MTVLLREAIGDRLRRTRTAQHRTLREVSRTARVSLGYLSEVERGRKEASSELLAAICDALSLPLPELLNGVAGDLRPHLVEDQVPVEHAVEGGRLVTTGTGDSKAELLLARQLPHKLTTTATVRASVAAA